MAPVWVSWFAGGRMFHSVLNAVLHPIVALWGLTSSSSWVQLPRPTETTTQAAGPNADRLLLIGSGIAVGYGTSSHEVSLAGHLARRLAEATGRGVFMDIEVSPHLLVKHTPRVLESQELTRFDAIILAFGGHEVATLQSSARWRQNLDAVLGIIESGAAQNQVFVMGIPLIDGLPPVYGGIVRRRALQFNTQSKQACASHFAATYVEVATTTEVERVRMTRGNYDRWSRVVAPQLVDTLNAIAGAPKLSASTAEGARQEAVDDLLFDPTLDAELREILESARNLFGVDVAAVNIIDGDLQRVQAIVGAPGRTMARQDSMCDFTIRTADVMVVEDIRDDTRFSKKYAARTKPGARFYAGYPIESTGGERVGSLCVIDAQPREFSVSDGVLLRELALRAQALIRAQH